MGRLRYHLAAGSVALGLALAPADPGLVPAIAACVGAGLAAARAARLGAVCALLVVAGAAAGDLRLDAIDRSGRQLTPYESIDERALLLERPRNAGTRTRAPVRILSGGARGAKLLAVREGPWPGAGDPGTELRVGGLVRPPPAAEDGGFDWAAHLARLGIAYELHLTRVEATGNRRGGLGGTIDTARRRAEAAINSSLPAAKAALMRGMVLGQDDQIDSLTRDDWRDAGTAHLLAVKI